MIEQTDDVHVEELPMVTELEKDEDGDYVELPIEIVSETRDEILYIKVIDPPENIKRLAKEISKTINKKKQAPKKKVVVDLWFIVQEDHSPEFNNTQNGTLRMRCQKRICEFLGHNLMSNRYDLKINYRIMRGNAGIVD